MTPFAVLVFIIFPALAGCLIGRPKGYPVWGLFVGAVLSWIGVIAVALWRPDHDKLTRRQRDEEGQS